VKLVALFFLKGQMMHYRVSVSGGAGSTLAAHICVKTRGAANTTLVFADTNCEDPSLYASLHHMIQVALPNVEFVWLTNGGRNIWDVFHSEGFIKRGGGNCKASLELKRKPLDTFTRERWPDPSTVTIVTGLDLTEEDRISRFNRVHLEKGYATWHPLAEQQHFLTPCDQVNRVRELGYPEQVMYQHGYPHNNCGGGCVLAGVSQWVGLYRDFPERFRYHAEQEDIFFKKTGYCILRDRRGGTVKPLTLLELEKRILADDLSGLQEFRSTCACMTPDAEDLTPTSVSHTHAARPEV
jgi:hypothetical protein